ncbi:uncharacterized protein N7473_005467 [Penicillium subrubescens]|uniref:uncharacterized protein n=1 Tax=Penicillium subrubescens TaxID=1316194 RepID=UPI002545BA07|nr:uncharacterized protein N7473_005467 [Penicillium subrubescens]KAJ5896068.1 hypothetical protein N7473_005467 [Penicillium subrubescens]
MTMQHRMTVGLLFAASQGETCSRCSTDPRNHFTDNVGTGFEAGIFSQWPESLGLAALRSANLVEKFANIARQEYLAVGLRLALHPQVDLATEHRWARINAAFGEDADLTSELVSAYIRGYIRGFQGGAIFGPQSVSTMTEHFLGVDYRRMGKIHIRVYPGNQFEYHLKPFTAAIAAGASQMMPYYGMQVGTLYEEIGFAFNRALITGLLREDLGIQGIICTDRELVTQKVIMGQLMPARAWGLEHLSRSARIQRIMEAGYDQLGGESCPELLRKNSSWASEEIVGNEEFCKLGAEVQRRSYTLLTNTDNCLPLRPNLHQTAKIYLEGIPTETVQTYGHQVVEDPTDADIALLRLKTPYEPRLGGFESLFHVGSLEFNEEEKAHQAEIVDAVPTVIVDIYADRPPVVPEVIQRASADFCPMEAPLTLSWTSFSGKGRLPFGLPSSMEAIQQSMSDTPYDTCDPLFRFGHGLRYSA